VILHVTVTRLRAPLVADSYGNQKPDWTAPASQDFLVHWSAKAGSEVLGDEPQTVTRVKLMGNPDLDLLATDWIVGPDGETYEVDGDVMRSYRKSQLHHIRAFLRRVDITGS
jgi:hypothetical protein